MVHAREVWKFQDRSCYPTSADEEILLACACRIELLGGEEIFYYWELCLEISNKFSQSRFLTLSIHPELPPQNSWCETENL